MQLYFSPGPSHLYPGVKQWCQEALSSGIASISHRSKRYSDIHAYTVDQLRQLLSIPQNYQVFFVASATEAMERTIQNCAKAQSYHLVNGSFSKRFAEIAQSLGKKPLILAKEPGHSFDSRELKIPPKTELVCMTHNETSTGTSTPLETIYAAKNKRPNVLVAVDIVSSAPLSGLDLSRVDVAFFSVQKGFGLPAGLGVIIVSPAALAKSRTLKSDGEVTGTYHSFDELSKSAAKSQTPETPNVLGIYLLGRVAADMNNRGIANLQAETDKKLALLHNLVENHPKFTHFVGEPKHRSRTIVTVDVKNGSGHYINLLETKGITLGSGYAEFKDRHIRIANFPALSIEEVDTLTSILNSN